MSDPFYCKLYIDTGEDIDDLNAVLNELALGIFSGLPVEMPLYRNENFDSDKSKQTSYDFIESSRYYSEIGMIEEVPEKLSNFQAGVASLVSKLRESGRIVTAACDFEDFIASETGWNWTKSQPYPPKSDH